MTGGDRSCPDRPETAGNKGLVLAARPRTPGPVPALPVGGTAELLGRITAEPPGLGSAAVAVPQFHSSSPSSQSGWPSQRQPRGKQGSPGVHWNLSGGQREGAAAGTGA